VKESIVYLLVLVFSETGAAKPTLKITVTPNQLSCEQSRVAIEKGSVYPIQICQCVPLDLEKAGKIAKQREQQ
jgi:hypothetical protein